MIANPGNLTSEAVPRPFTLNDMRVHNVYEEEPEPMSPRALSGMAAVAVLAIGSFVWLDPLHLFTPHDAAPKAPDSVSSTTPATVPSTTTEQAAQGQEAVPPPSPVFATKSAAAPIPPAPVAQASQVPAPVIRLGVAAAKPESRGTPTDKIHTAARRVSPEETMAPPVLLTSPEEKSAPPALQSKPEDKTDAPTVAPMVAPTAAPTVAPSVAPTAAPTAPEDTKSAPKPPAANAQLPATE